MKKTLFILFILLILANIGKAQILANNGRPIKFCHYDKHVIYYYSNNMDTVKITADSILVDTFYNNITINPYYFYNTVANSPELNSVNYLDSGLMYNGNKRLISEDANMMTGLSKITFSVWIYPFTYNSYAGILTTNKVGTGVATLGGIRLGNVPATGQYFMYVTKGTAISSITTSGATINNWSHIVGTWDGTTGTNNLKLYHNGNYKTQNSGITGSWVTSDVFYMGYDRYSNTYFNGIIAEIRIYNKVLTPTEIEILYNNGINTINGKYKFIKQ